MRWGTHGTGIPHLAGAHGRCGAANRRAGPGCASGSCGTGVERRQVTVMFCDLVGSTELASRLDLEDLREVTGRYHACAAANVSRFDGFVAKYMGDELPLWLNLPELRAGAGRRAPARQQPRRHAPPTAPPAIAGAT